MLHLGCDVPVTTSKGLVTPTLQAGLNLRPLGASGSRLATHQTPVATQVQGQQDVNHGEEQTEVSKIFLNKEQKYYVITPQPLLRSRQNKESN